MPTLPRLPLPVLRFLLGQQLFWAARVTIGVSLPCLALLGWPDGSDTLALASGVGTPFSQGGQDCQPC